MNFCSLAANKFERVKSLLKIYNLLPIFVCICSLSRAIFDIVTDFYRTRQDAMTMGERLSSLLRTVFTVIGGYFTLASSIVQRAPPVFLGLSLGKLPQEAQVPVRLVRQGHRKTHHLLAQVRLLGSRETTQFGTSGSAYRRCNEILRARRSRRTGGSSQRGREVELVEWSRYLARKLGTAKDMFMFLATYLVNIIIAKI